MWSITSGLTLCLTFLSVAVTTAQNASVALPAPARYGTLSFKVYGSVTRVTFNNPPINLVNTRLLSDLYDFMVTLQPSDRTTPAPKVVIFDSANPDFFLSHIDFNFILLPTTPELTASASQYGMVAQMFQTITSTAFIAEINGRAFGAGHELLVQMDMRFAGPNARTGPIENSVGLFAGAGGELYLGQNVGKSRALEIAMSSTAIDGPRGEAIGFFNRYYNNQQSLTNAVNTLAQRIALFPADGLNQTKSALSYLNPPATAFANEAAAAVRLRPKAEQQALVRKFISLSQNQTRSPFELNLPESLAQLYAD